MGVDNPRCWGAHVFISKIFKDLKSSKMGDTRVSSANPMLKKTQEEVDEIVDIMSDNLVKVMERDHKLSDLHDRADQLEEGAGQFQKTTTKLKNKEWWKNYKLMIGIAGIVLVFISLAVVLAIL